MRRSHVVGFGLAATLAGVAAAQQPGEAPRPDSARPHAGAHGDRFDRRGDRGGLLFKDITLTDAQKTRLKELRTADRTKFDANREQVMKEFDEARAARQRGDTAAARAIMQRHHQVMEQARDQHLAAIREVLTAEQRLQFDKNVAELKERKAKRGDRMGKHSRR